MDPDSPGAPGASGFLWSIRGCRGLLSCLMVEFAVYVAEWTHTKGGRQEKEKRIGAEKDDI